MRQTQIVVTTAALIMLAAGSAQAAEKSPPPYPHYWISVATANQSLPGMSEEAAGMASLFGGRGAAFGPRRELTLQLESPREVADPRADHLIPPVQKMGERLPLVTPKPEKAEYTPERGQREKPEPYEKPKARMLIYWGCGEQVAKGQPRVIDTASMSPADFGRAFSGRSGTRHTPPMPRKGWTYGDWPNHNDRTDIPKDASLAGEHQLKGNYIPDISFSLDQRRDFMAPVSFGPLQKTSAGAWPFTWQQIPTAIGYFATAMGHNQKSGETVFWSSSELPETGFGLMDYLTPADVQRFIKEKVVMPASRTSCTVPAGVFKDVDGAMLQFIAYGEELNIVHPPRPKDPKQPWNPQWSVKVRLKSTGTMPLMEGGEQDEKPSRRRPSSERGEGHEQQPSDTRKGGGMMEGLKGMFGF